MLKDMQAEGNTAIIVAAGNGSRLGSDIPKQFMQLNGREILSYSVMTFLDHPQVSDVVIVTSETFLDHVKSKYPDCQVVLGGATRQDSVYNGLMACPRDTKFVLVHDAARPLVPVRVIDDCLRKLESFDGVAPAINPIDSMVRILGEDFQNLDRADLRIIQTPQCFPIDILRRAHASGKVDTDEIGLVKRAIPDVNLGFILGASETMKITRSNDIESLEILLRSKQV
ncbi:2-C-methyl-D-erythritol 4-phosphate cytidylyltransferase [bacterium]|nr:2-C-methyl-D-erythritol 4-phosphate cytidylyltransferase [bacterium]